MKKNKNIKPNSNLENVSTEAPIMPSAEIESQTVFKSILAKIAAALKISKKQEEKRGVGNLDAKVVEKLEKAGHVKLAKSVAKSAKRHNHKKAKSSVNWLAFGLSFLTIAGLSVGGFWLYENLYGKNGPQLSDLQNGIVTPAIALRATEKTNSGYIAPQSTFEITFESEPVGNVENSIKVYPEFEYDVEVANVDGEFQAVIIPTEDLDNDVDYVVSLEEGLTFEDGSKLRKDLSWVLKVEPKFAVLSVTPRFEAYGVPVNTVIEVEFNHKNIDIDEFSKAFSISPAVKGRFELYGMKAVFIPSANLAYSTSYSVFIDGEYANLDGDTLGENYTVSFYTDNGENDTVVDQVYWMGGNSGIDNSSKGFAIAAGNYHTDESITYTLFSVSTDKALNLLKDGSYIYKLPADAKEIVTKSFKPYEYFAYEPKDKGFYVIRAEIVGKSKPIYKFYVKSDLSLIGNVGEGDSFVYVYNMADSAAVKDAKVAGYNDGKLLDTKNSNGEGYVQIAKSSLFIAQKGDNYAVIDSSANANGWFYYSTLQTSAFTRLDKPIYKPGDTIKFNGVVRTVVDGKIEIPKDENSLKITAIASSLVEYNSEKAETPVYEKRISFDLKNGTFNGNFELPRNIDVGYLYINVEYKGEVIDSNLVNIAEYVTPKESYTIEFDKQTYLKGEDAKITVTGRDYAGRPLTGKSIKLNYRVNDIEASIFDNGLPIPDWDYWGELEKELMISLDKNGVYTQSIDLAELVGLPNGGQEMSPAYTIIADLSAAEEDVYIDYSSDNLYYSMADYDVRIKSPAQLTNVYIGEDVTVELSTGTYWDSKPVGGKKVTLEISRDWYEVVQDGTEYNDVLKIQVPKYTNVFHTESVINPTLVTLNSEGKATLELADVKEGSYDVRISYEDKYLKKYDGFLYIEEKYNFVDSINVLTVDTSNYSYDAGEKAFVTVKSAYKATGLLFLSNRKVQDIKELKFNEPFATQNFEYSVTDSLFPSAQVCAFTIVTHTGLYGIFGPVWAYDCSSFTVEGKTGQLDVKVTTDKEQYKPGDSVKGTVSVTYGDGKAASNGNVAIRVIDQALIDTYVSKDYSTYEEETLRDYMYVNLLSPFAWAIGTNISDNDDGLGAGGNGDDNSMRSNFDDSVYFNPNIELDGNGKASFEFTSPDLLTTWDVQALVVSGSASFGISSTDFKSTLSRSIDMRLPNFVRSGDKLEAEIFVDNFDSKFSGTIEVSCKGCVKEFETYKVSLDQNQQENVKFTLTPEAGAQTLTLYSKLIVGEDVADSVERTVKVQPNGVLQSNFTIGTLDSADNSFVTEIDYGKNFDPETAKMSVTVSKRFAFGNYVYPVDFSIKATRELSYAIIVNSYLYKNYDVLELTVSKDELLTNIRSAYQILSQNRNSSGGYGEYGYAGTDLDASVEAAYALASLEMIGETVSSVEKSELSKYFSSVITSEKHSGLDKLNALKGLSSIDRNSAFVYLVDVDELMDSEETLVDEKTRKLSENPLALAYLMQVYNNIGSTGDSSYWAKFLTEIANEKGGVAYWSIGDLNNSRTYSDSYVTSQAYLALYPIEEWRLKYLVRNWFVETSALSNASYFEYGSIMYSLLIADEGMLENSDKQVEFELLVNGKKVGSENYVLNKGDNKGSMTINIDSKLLKEGKNRVEVSTLASADLYITVGHSFVTTDVASNDEVEISRRFISITTGKEVSLDGVPYFDPIKVEVTVTPRGGKLNNVIVKDYLPSGFVAVDFGSNAISDTMRQQFWALSSGLDSNNWGSISKDSISFVAYELKKDKGYKFNYVMVPRFTGTGSAGSTLVYDRDTSENLGYLEGEMYKVK